MDDGFLMEVCVDSVESAVNAERGGEARGPRGRGAAAGPVLTRLFAGAGRIELCAGLVEGGTTPSMGECVSPLPAPASPRGAASLPRGKHGLPSPLLPSPSPAPSPPPPPASPVVRSCRSRC